MESFLLALLAKAVAQFPIASSLLMIIGVCRVVMKPLFALLRAFVLSTPTPKDDLLLDEVEHSKAYLALVWFLDYTASIKLPGSK